MSVSLEDFWKLLIESQLLSAERCEQLGQEFGQVKGASQQSNSRTLAAWLQAENVITRYQAKILLAGRPGPFVYGEYHVEERIKSGPLAGHFRAGHAATGHPVILIFLTGTAIQVPRLWNQVLQRVAAYCEVVHPHLARCYELVDLTSFKFLVMEGLQGQPLDQVLAAAGGRFAPAEACRIARQTALGLGQLHQSGHVRGDIRPAALWMEAGGNIKIPHNPTVHPAPLDLRSFDPSNRMLERADFLAPELVQADKAPDALTDIYALGCTLYNLLAGQPPFPGGTVPQKMGRHATEPIRPLDTTFGVPQPIAQLVSYLMAKNPAVRYQSAVDVANALGQYVDHAVVTPLPALAVPTLPAYESAIMAKRARQATQAAATPVVGVSPTATPGLPAAATAMAPSPTVTPGRPAEAEPEGVSAGTGHPPAAMAGAAGSKWPRWFTLRNLLLAGGMIVVLALIVGLATCVSCSSDRGPGDDATQPVDDEGTPASGPASPAGSPPAQAPPPDMVDCWPPTGHLAGQIE